MCGVKGIFKMFISKIKKGPSFPNNLLKFTSFVFQLLPADFEETLRNNSPVGLSPNQEYFPKILKFCNPSVIFGAKLSTNHLIS